MYQHIDIMCNMCSAEEKPNTHTNTVSMWTRNKTMASSLHQPTRQHSIILTDKYNREGSLTTRFLNLSSTSRPVYTMGPNGSHEM